MTSTRRGVNCPSVHWWIRRDCLIFAAMGVVRLFRGVAVVAFTAMLSAAAVAGHGDTGGHARLSVQCSRTSAFVNIQIAHIRKIGKVALEIRDKDGRVLYREEGKALTDELVRRLDKAVLPRGTHVLSVQGKDLALSQAFTID